MTDNKSTLPPVMYGVWIPTKGWWRAPDKNGERKAYAEFRRDIAQRYANWIGNRARVEVIDDSLVANEQELITAENKKGEKWATLKNWLSKLVIIRR